MDNRTDLLNTHQNIDVVLVSILKEKNRIRDFKRHFKIPLDMYTDGVRRSAKFLSRVRRSSKECLGFKGRTAAEADEAQRRTEDDEPRRRTEDERESEVNLKSQR